VGLFARIDGRPPIVLTYVDNKQNTEDDPGTHPGMNFGPANAKRYLIACVGVIGDLPTSCTIGGVTATRHVQTVSSFGSVRSIIYSALVPTGTSGSVTLSGANGVSSVALYSAINLISGSASDTDSDFGLSPLSMSVDVPQKGFLLATAYRATTTAGQTASWSGLTTVDLNLRFGGPSNFELHSAGQYIATSAVTRSLTVTLTGNNAFSCAAASFR